MNVQESTPSLLSLLSCKACHEFTDQSKVDIILVRCNVRKFANEKFKVWRCSKCQSINAYDRVDLEHYYINYPGSNIPLNFQFRRAYDKRIRLLKRFGLRKDWKILDYGCGKGSFIKRLREKGYKNVFGHDLYSPEFNNRKVLNQKFHMIVSYDVIEHFDQPNDFIQLASKLLIPNGILVLATPDASQLDLKHSEKFLLELHMPYHRVLFTPSSLENILKKYNFELKGKQSGFNLDLSLPFLNYRFITNYVQISGGNMDVAAEPPHFKLILKSPKLIFQGIFGLFYPLNTNMTMIFQLK